MRIIDGIRASNNFCNSIQWNFVWICLIRIALCLYWFAISISWFEESISQLFSLLKCNARREWRFNWTTVAEATELKLTRNKLRKKLFSYYVISLLAGNGVTSKRPDYEPFDVANSLVKTWLCRFCICMFLLVLSILPIAIVLLTVSVVCRTVLHYLQFITFWHCRSWWLVVAFSYVGCYSVRLKISMPYCCIKAYYCTYQLSAGRWYLK